MQLQESAEMYLETIYILSRQKNAVRSIDIAEYMNYSKPSVSRAVGLLKQGGYIIVNEDGFITLTGTGLAAAAKIYERHTIISTVLEMLGVGHDAAVEDACRIEHVISDESFEAIKAHLEKYGA